MSNVIREFGMSNPNNKNYISLPKTEKQIASIFNTMIMEYNPKMYNWMKETGHGSNARKFFWFGRFRTPFCLWTAQIKPQGPIFCGVHVGQGVWVHSCDKEERYTACQCHHLTFFQVRGKWRTEIITKTRMTTTMLMKELEGKHKRIDAYHPQFKRRTTLCHEANLTSLENLQVIRRGITPLNWTASAKDEETSLIRSCCKWSQQLNSSWIPRKKKLLVRKKKLILTSNKINCSKKICTVKNKMMDEKITIET